MTQKFKSKYGNWALITGATSGIGKELASQIAAEKINIVLVARKENELKEYALSLSASYGIETKYISADLSKPEDIEKVKTIDKEINLLVLAAGIAVNGAFEKTSLENELSLIRLNIESTMHLTHHFSKAMVKQQRGGILLLASIAGHMPNPYFSNYAGSKAYVLNFGASLYGELKPKGVDVSVLSPGLTKTPMTNNTAMDWSKMPMKAMEASEVAKTGLMGLGKRFLLVPGSRNRIMLKLSKISPFNMLVKQNEKTIRNAINKDRL